jgi:hypothetical protein
VKTHVLVLACLITGWAGHPAAQGAPPEYHLKAAFVSKFPEFVEWPESALRNRESIDLCVTRPNPFGRTLSDLVAGERIGDRSLITRDVDAGEITDCHVLFISTGVRGERRALLARAATRPVLTIGDQDDFLDDGGIVNLRLVDGRVRFDVNVAASARGGVRLRSQLLRLALSVRGATP